MPRCLGFATSSIVAATSMCPAIFSKICGYWVKSLSLDISGRSNRGSIDIISTSFPTLRGNDSHHLLVLSYNLM